jgi:hypothetical protein
MVKQGPDRDGGIEGGVECCGRAQAGGLVFDRPRRLQNAPEDRAQKTMPPDVHLIPATKV